MVALEWLGRFVGGDGCRAQGFFLRWWKRSKIDGGDGCITLNILQTIEWVSCIVREWYVDKAVSEQIRQEKFYCCTVRRDVRVCAKACFSRKETAFKAAADRASVPPCPHTVFSPEWKKHKYWQICIKSFFLRMKNFISFLWFSCPFTFQEN